MSLIVWIIALILVAVAAGLVIMVTILLTMRSDGDERVDWLALLPRARRTSIASARYGLVCLQGTARGRATLRSPIFGVPCVAYSARVEEMEAIGGETARWHVKFAQTRAVPFDLEDATGRVEVQADDEVFLKLRRERVIVQDEYTSLPEDVAVAVQGLAYSPDTRPRLRVRESRLEDGQTCTVIGKVRRGLDSGGDVGYRNAPMATFIIVAPRHGLRVSDLDVGALRWALRRRRAPRIAIRLVVIIGLVVAAVLGLARLR